MDDMWTRVGAQLMDRVTGPMHFRLYLQPGMAAVMAIIAGLEDARQKRTPYFWRMISRPGERVEALKDLWKSDGRVLVLAIVLDAIYQIYTIHFFYLGEAIIVALVLAIVPYVILRGIVTRIARRWLARRERRPDARNDQHRH